MKKIKYILPSESQVEINFSESFFYDFPLILKKRKVKERPYFIIDKNVYKLYKSSFLKMFSDIERSSKFILSSNEKNKSIGYIEKIYSDLIKKGFSRDTVIIAVGGGVVGDASGFIASSYMRGIKIIHVPTTLLAMIDSSIGGKTGVNFFDTKNIIGSFYHPELILVDNNFLKTLPKEEIISGFGELIKYGILSDKKYFHQIKNLLLESVKNDIEVPNNIILKAMQIKVDVVKSDEKEAGIRKILNLGHTFAHAYEVATNHKLSHGKAVLLGIHTASTLSDMLGQTSENIKNKMEEILKSISFKINFNKLDLTSISKIMLRDKKNRDGKIKFVLPRSYGEMLVGFEVEKKIFIKAIEETFKLTSN